MKWIVQTLNKIFSFGGCSPERKDDTCSMNLPTDSTFKCVCYDVPNKCYNYSFCRVRVDE